MSQPSIFPATKASLSQRIGISVASAKAKEASRLYDIAQRTYDHLESKGLFRPHGWDLHSVGDSVLCHFERLLFNRRQTTATDDQFIDVSMDDPGDSERSAQDNNATTHEVKNVTRDELEEVSENFYEAAKSLLVEEGENKKERNAPRERGEEDESGSRGRSLVRRGSRPTLLAKALNEMLTEVDEFHNSCVPPE